MKASVIRYRVADFLKDHPPFDLCSLEELLTFSGTGRVIFHEDDIYLFRKGEKREAVLWVIQQGKAEIIDETPAGEHLRDVLGPGDILGLAGQTDGAAYSHTARTATEVILYSFDLPSFEALISKHPEAARFLTAHLSATTRQTKALQAPANRERLLNEKEKAIWLNAPAPTARWIARRLATCAAELSLCEAAKLAAAASCGTVVVVASDKRPIGLLTKDELCKFLANGPMRQCVDAGSLMDRSFQTAAPDLSAGDYLLEMLRSRRQILAITADGSINSPLGGLVSDFDLSINCGRNPVALMHEILTAETVDELAYLRQRIDALASETLVGPSVIEWLSQMLGELNATMIERIVVISKAEMASAGRPDPGLSACCVLFGAAARQELLTAQAPHLGIIYADPPDREDVEAKKYFRTLTRKIAAKLHACGFAPSSNEASASDNSDCRAISEWREFYAGLMQDPIGHAIYSKREYFDLRTVAGDRSLGLKLEESILNELKNCESFIPVLANDTIASLPPLTFFQGAIIDPDGAVKKTFDIEKNALAPMIDSARVLALARREISSPSTIRRLATSARATPQSASILNDAVEAWRIVAYQQASAQFNPRAEKGVLLPMRLSRFDQRMLKSAFDSIRRLLELTYTIYSSPVAP